MRLRSLPFRTESLLLAGLSFMAFGFVAQRPIQAQESAQPSDLRLGSVSFENSGAAEAQPAFDRGLLLLHSFEYGPAAAAFREAQEIDPDFAMSYWGEAMTYNHPVWMRQNRDAALAALNRLAPTPAERASRTGSEREAMYLGAVESLYGEGDKHTRDDAYAVSMQDLHEAYPDDEDAAAFHALALLGTAHEGRDFRTYMSSAGILEQVVDAHPDHPGIVHYLIHSYDDPIHAPLGIRAARAYSKIAPDAPHAQHMTSHIFVALGMWNDVVVANENSMRVNNRGRAARGLGPGACGHYNFWLEYGYLQQGRDEDALRLVRECYDRVIEASGGEAANSDRAPVGSYVRMLARYVVDTREASVPALDWPLDLDLTPDPAFTMAFARGYASAGSGDAAAAGAALERMRELNRVLAEGDGSDDSRFERRQILIAELESLTSALAGDDTQAIGLARQAAEAEAALPFEFGPPNIDKPTYELLGERLAAAGRVQEARRAFETALARTPERAAAREGLAGLE